MKKSDQKALRDLLSKDTRPRLPKTTDDLSDDLARQFDDGTALPGSKPTQGTQGTLPTQGSQPVAPARDFHKVANSIAREAVPAGLFKGKSKQIYDYLYLRTRGAIVPARTVQVTRREIMEAAHIGSDKTIRENLAHLRNVGLISWGGTVGAQDGNLYTVHLPEEALATQGTRGTQGSPGHDLPGVPPVETTRGTRGVSPSFQRASGEDKTSFKTNTDKTDDDDWLPGLRAAVKGQSLPKVAALLVSLVKLLDARTEVSSYDALLAHVLTRKLAHRGNTAQGWPNDEQFRGGRVEIEVTAEDLEEYKKNRAELDG